MTDADTRRRELLTAIAGSCTAGLAGCQFGGPTSTPTADRRTTAPSTAGGTDSPTPTASQPGATTKAYPTWTTGRKFGVGTVADHETEDPSNVWFTLTKGALTEPRFPRIDLMNLRSLDFLVTDGEGYAVRTLDVDPTEDDAVERTVEPGADDALVFRHVFAGTDREWTLEVEYVTDPDGPAVLADVAFDADGPYDLYALVETAAAGGTAGDEARRLADRGGHAVGVVEQEGSGVVRTRAGEEYTVASALAAGEPLDWATVAVPDDDGLGELLASGELPAESETAEGASVLVGRLAAGTGEHRGTLALGFARSADPSDALATATNALDRGYGTARSGYVDSWRAYLEDVDLPASVADDEALASQYRTALQVLKAVEDKTFAGAGIASPSVPWGTAVGCEQPEDYGYSYVWARDLYQVFTAFEAAGDVDSARLATEYVFTVQQDDSGFLPQNTFVDGRTRWGGEQLDEIAFPLVMAGQLQERHGLGFDEVAYDFEHVRRGARYLLASGPGSEQERWEEEAGLSPSTIAAEIAGLVAAGRLAAETGRDDEALLYLGVADHFQRNVEDWCATTTGADGHGPTPYYIRVNDDRDPDDGADRDLANGGPTLDERAVIDAGFLELVRLGLKPADDEVVRNSLSVVDDTIRVDTPNGPAWYRYNGDGYGEGEESAGFGAPWPAAEQGKGRLWPIFTGERAEYELLAGTEDGALAPRNLLRTMQRFANDGRMIPEQVWDREAESPYGWTFGEGTGAATPLAWSMAQFVRLAHGIDAGEPVETPAAAAERYEGGTPPAGPALTVDLPEGVQQSSPLTVTGQTDADRVLVYADDELRRVEVPADGSFEASVPLADARTMVTVVATSGGDPASAGTAVVRKSVTYAP